MCVYTSRCLLGLIRITNTVRKLSGMGIFFTYLLLAFDFQVNISHLAMMTTVHMFILSIQSGRL